MLCRTIIDLIEKEADGITLTPVEEKIATKHILSCKSCAERYEFYKKLTAVCNTATKLEASSRFETNILSKLTEKSTPEKGYIIDEILGLFRAPNWKLMPVIAVFILVISLPTVIYHFTVKQQQQMVWLKFKLEMANAQSVALVGDFNNWDVQSGQMIRNNGNWNIIVPVKAKQEHQYMFVINGTKYIPDPKSNVYVEDETGCRKSVLKI